MDQGSTKELEQEFKESVTQHLKTQNVVMPYFRSLKSQNTNADLKDRRLGTFTGVNNVEYRSKEEIEALPPIKDLTHINGITFQPDIQRYQHYMASGKNHNVSPVEKQYIGPGLGIDPHTPAEGGFHSFFRILPDNVNGYRKNTFGGTVVHGASATGGREFDDFESTRSLDNKLSEAEQARLGARGHDAPFGAVSAQSYRSQVQLGEPRTVDACFPNGSLVSQNPSVYANSAQGTRTDDRTQRNEHLGGVFRGLNGGYENSQYIDFTTDRETENCHRTNVHGNQFGTYTPFQEATPTMRGQQQTCNSGTLVSGCAAPSARVGFNEARPTHKQHTLSEYTGNAGMAAGHTIGDTSLTRNTSRGEQQTCASSGPAGTVIPGAANYNTVSQVYASRELATVTDYTPNQARNTTNSRVWGSVTQFGSDANNGRICSNPQGLGADTHSNTSQLGTTQYKSVVPIENNRDFGYTPVNPLRTSITNR
jgi:hypothetical protein